MYPYSTVITAVTTLVLLALMMGDELVEEAVVGDDIGITLHIVAQSVGFFFRAVYITVKESGDAEQKHNHSAQDEHYKYGLDHYAY